MSSGFVSGGTTDAPIERSDEWLAAQVELEANRRRKADEAAAQNSGRSLFETLEANKGFFFALIAQTSRFVPRAPNADHVACP